MQKVQEGQKLESWVGKVDKADKADKDGTSRRLNDLDPDISRVRVFLSDQYHETAEGVAAGIGDGGIVNYFTDESEAEQFGGANITVENPTIQELRTLDAHPDVKSLAVERAVER